MFAGVLAYLHFSFQHDCRNIDIIPEFAVGSQIPALVVGINFNNILKK